MKMTSVRRAVLKQLTCSYPDNCEYPPYTVNQIAKRLNLPLSNIYRTLTDLVSAGLVVKEECKIWVFGYENGLGAITKHDCQRDGYVYYNASTIEADKAARIFKSDNAFASFDRLYQ